MALTFHKMHGLGNDFVLLDLRSQDFAPDAAWVRGVADRHTGVGCDQLLVLDAPPGPGAVAAFSVWNADGSRAEQCGNGVRCIGRYLERRGEAPDGPFRLAGPAGEVRIELLDGGLVRVDMGVPVFDPERIPAPAPGPDGWLRLEWRGTPVIAGAVSMGNPHAVVPVPDVATPEVEGIGSWLSTAGPFPQGCNAGFAEVVDRGQLRLRVFERGAGETRACGSGACAAVAVLRRAERVGGAVKVVQDGGTLTIEWPGGDARLMMTGPAVHVFEGTLS